MAVRLLEKSKTLVLGKSTWRSQPDFPGSGEIGSGWILKTRLLTSAGVLHGAQETNGVFTLVPMDVMFGRKDGLLSVDMGAGGALLTDCKHDCQNFGGPFQFVWTFGATSRAIATMYGDDSRGADLHLFELNQTAFAEMVGDIYDWHTCGPCALLESRDVFRCLLDGRKERLCSIE